MHERAPTWPDAAPTLSWWQQECPSRGWAALDAPVEADVVVVGGGVTGCSAAWHLAKAGATVVLLEARDLASGASGRNGGFLLAGLAHRSVPLSQLVGSARAAELYALTAEARERLFEAAVSIGAGGTVARTGSLRMAVDRAELDELEAEAALLDAAGVPVERLSAGQLGRSLGPHFLGGLRFPLDGRSSPAGWVRALGAAAADAGARIYEHSPVARVEDDADGALITTAHGIRVRAGHCIVATEAWIAGLLPELAGRVLPYRSQVLAAAAPRDGAGSVERVLPHVAWSRRGWDYVQQAADGTIVIGGEEAEDVDRLRHWAESPEDVDQAWLESWLRRVLGMEPQVLARWAGVLGQTRDGFPFVGPLRDRPRVLACGGWGGAGNVLGFLAGDLVASLALGGADMVPVEFRAARE